MNHLLIFDYFADNFNRPVPQEAVLANGFVNPRELKDFNVTVFATHVHADHYSEKIFDWKAEIPHIQYVLGFQPQGIDHDYILVGPRAERSLEGMKVSTIRSNDTGVGFLVGVDGLTIFHAGDHANREPDLSGNFPPEIDYLADKELEIDLAFFPISGCGFGAPECVQKGVHYAMDKLKPHILLPMHAGDSFYKYEEFAEETNKKGCPSRVEYAEYRGDHFFYEKDAESPISMK
ncbi:MAG: MBL fold metallo-hydrolase [Planctomycetes bacterium]|nr:MBL fold metallo-hydrolase [Planctomycetota bacterium]